MGMCRRSPILLLGLFLSGCEQAGLSPTVVKSSPKARTHLKSNLFLGCAHAVIGPDLICGVLTAQNTGKEPIALVDRWNSWGAYQWRLTLGTQSAGNPQRNWWANCYT